MKDLKKKTDQDLAVLLKEKYDALSTFRFGASGSRVKNVKEGRMTRRDIARIKTELRARALAGKGA